METDCCGEEAVAGKQIGDSGLTVFGPSKYLQNKRITVVNRARLAPNAGF